MPIVIGNTTSDLENLDIIMPNCLKLGRNNARSPTEPLNETNQIQAKSLTTIVKSFSHGLRTGYFHMWPN